MDGLAILYKEDEMNEPTDSIDLIINLNKLIILSTMLENISSDYMRHIAKHTMDGVGQAGIESIIQMSKTVMKGVAR